jgi:oxygen-independent coproporphyrinogen III oxidase
MSESCPISHVYVHVPFCHRICPYCAFYKHTPGATSMPDFVAAILNEARLYKARFDVRPKTIYLGGGTPTALSESHLEALLIGLREVFGSGELEEFSSEANPRNIGRAKAAMMQRCGINRISLGVQAWDESTLQTLGRDHSPGEAAETFLQLREAGITSLNIDLMFSIPGQTMASWSQTLDRTLNLQPDHISAYNLNYEEDTAFFEKLTAGHYQEEPERDADLFFHAVDRLHSAGYEQYEVSNYARPGHQSRHNSAYWHGADYLGLGPSSVSTVGRQRWKNVPETQRYISGIEAGLLPQQDAEMLDDSQVQMERVGLELRTAAGTPREKLPHLTDGDLAPYVEAGLMVATASQLRLTVKGRALADSIVAELLP